jgi:hypothetical protein
MPFFKESIAVERQAVSTLTEIQRLLKLDAAPASAEVMRILEIFDSAENGREVRNHG